MTRIIFSMIFFALGFFLIRKAFWLYQTFGVIGLGEKLFGGGGTYTLYKVVGVIFVLGSLLYLFGAINGLFASPNSNLGL